MVVKPQTPLMEDISTISILIPIQEKIAGTVGMKTKVRALDCRLNLNP